MARLQNGGCPLWRTVQTSGPFTRRWVPWSYLQWVPHAERPLKVGETKQNQFCDGKDGFSTRHRRLSSGFLCRKASQLGGIFSLCLSDETAEYQTYCFAHFSPALSLGLRMSRMWHISLIQLVPSHMHEAGMDEKAIGSSVGLDLPPIYLRYSVLFVRVSTQIRKVRFTLVPRFFPWRWKTSLGTRVCPLRHGCLETPVRTCWKVEWE